MGAISHTKSTRWNNRTKQDRHLLKPVLSQKRSISPRTNADVCVSSRSLSSHLRCQRRRRSACRLPSNPHSLCIVVHTCPCWQNRNDRLSVLKYGTVCIDHHPLELSLAISDDHGAVAPIERTTADTEPQRSKLAKLISSSCYWSSWDEKRERERECVEQSENHS